MDTISQQVIDFTAGYCDVPASSISATTDLASIGISTEPDTINYTIALEDNFGLVYQKGDANGMVTVGDAIALIKKKMNG